MLSCTGVVFSHVYACSAVRLPNCGRFMSPNGQRERKLFQGRGKGDRLVERLGFSRVESLR